MSLCYIMPEVTIKKFSRAKTNISIPNDPIPDPVPPVEEESSSLSVVREDVSIANEDDFLADLNNNVFVSQSTIEKTEKQRIKEEKEAEKWEKKAERERKQLEKAQLAYEKATKKSAKDVQKGVDDAIFSEKGSEIYGRDKLELIAKVQQYKVLFPENKKLKDLKVKRNATVEELQQYIAECEAIVDTDTVESFVTDSILATMKMAEYASVRTKYNIKGLSEMLRKNPQFNSLCKQLYLKYKIFSKIPPEQQMLMLVATSAWICIEKNKQEANQSAGLSKMVDPTNFM